MQNPYDIFPNKMDLNSNSTDDEFQQASLKRNERFQNLIGKNFTNTEDQLKRARELRELCESFEKDSLECGKEIIEDYVGIEKKNLKGIKKLENKGIAGGEKYIHKELGIFFKFCHDNHGLYGGDEGIMKAAGNELKAMMEIASCRIKNLHFPLIGKILH